MYYTLIYGIEDCNLYLHTWQVCPESYTSEAGNCTSRPHICVLLYGAEHVVEHLCTPPGVALVCEEVMAATQGFWIEFDFISTHCRVHLQSP